MKCPSPWNPGMHPSQSNKSVLFITAKDGRNSLRSCKRMVKMFLNNLHLKQNNLLNATENSV